MKPPFGDLANLAWSQFWQVTAAALAVAVLVWLFCRRRPHLAYMLWLLVILKCLTPPILSSPTGVFSWAQVRATTPPARDAPEDAAASTPLSADVAISQQPPPLPEPEPPAPEAFTERKTVTGNVPPPKAPERRVQAAVVLGVVWLLGSVVYAGIVIGLRVRWSLLLRNTSTAADRALGSLVADLSKRLGVRRQVRLLVTSKPLGPVAYGVLRPTVLLPELLLAEKSPQQIEAVLAHELTHVRRHDNLVGILQLLAQAIWWFHPFVWWANRQICRQRERCCDEEVVARLGCEPGRYAQSLLDVLKLKHKLRPVFAFPGVRPGEITSKRMEEIMEPARKFHRRTPRWCWLLTLAAATLILPGRELLIGGGAAASAEGQAPPAKAQAAVGELLQTLYDPNPTTRGCFGSSVCTLGNNFLASGTDGVYLIDTSSGKLLRTFKNPSPGTYKLGESVAAMGNNVLVSAPGGSGDRDPPRRGAVCLFDGSTGKLLQTFRRPSANDKFGGCVAAVGNTVLIGAPFDDTVVQDGGVVYLYDAATGQLVRTLRQPEPAAGDCFGWPMAVVGNKVLVGAPGPVWHSMAAARGGWAPGAAYLFDATTGKLLRSFRSPTPTAGDQFGDSLAAVGKNFVIGAPGPLYGPLPRKDPGVAYLFDGTSGKLLHTFQDPAPAANHGFGFGVSAMGKNVIIGEYSWNLDCTIYLFDGTTGELLCKFQNPSPPAPGEDEYDFFGWSFAAVGNNVLISAIGDDTGAEAAGVVYLFKGVAERAAGDAD